MTKPSVKDLVREMLARREALLAEVTEAMRTQKIFRAKMRRGAGTVTITRSTRKGIAYQLTYWNAQDEPTGHLDEPSLEASVRDLSGVIELG